MAQTVGIGFCRRSLLCGAASAGLAAVLPRGGWGNPRTVRDHKLVAAVAQASIVGAAAPATQVWAYQGSVPGPEIRIRQGDRLRVLAENQLPQETTVHWHGIRVPNAMDGVAHLTQPPIGTGQSFLYEFDCLDAGTFWYHPHTKSFEQVERGLAGALIVEEAQPIAVDRDLVWMLDDWRLTPEAQISEDFGHMMDVSHAGRLGNTVTINGRVPEQFAVRSGERIRLRLVNAANARIFALEFQGHQPFVIALDGQPTEPYMPERGRIILGPAQRADLLLDCMGRPGDKFTVIDRFYPQQQFRLVDLSYDKGAPLRQSPLDASMRLPPNPLADPALQEAVRHTVEFGGGAMDPKLMRGMNRGGSGRSGMMSEMMDRMRRGAIWTINGVSVPGNEHAHAPLLTLDRGKSYVLDMLNDTEWWHPMHLHGHVFRVLSRNGRPNGRREWLDTVLVAPKERVEIAFVADNPGDWMFHCHILEHQQGGMTGTIRVA
ncbi:MAG: multicopper oxidase family protein [Xanthobacteraceae bacterium]|nr:multicopper oxidase family protein [Xanthobacteraceae bacterium]